MAPGGEVDRVRRDDQRRELRLGGRHALEQHGDGVAAERVHLRVQLEPEDAVAEIDQAGAGVAGDDGRPRLGVGEEQHAGRGRHAPAIAERVGAGSEPVGDERRHPLVQAGYDAGQASTSVRRPIASAISNGPRSQP